MKCGAKRPIFAFHTTSHCIFFFFFFDGGPCLHTQIHLPTCTYIPGGESLSVFIKQCHFALVKTLEIVHSFHAPGQPFSKKKLSCFLGSATSDLPHLFLMILLYISGSNARDTSAGFFFLRAFFFLRRWWNNLPFPPSLLSEVVEQPPFSPFSLLSEGPERESRQTHIYTNTVTTYSPRSNTFLYTSLDFGRHGSLQSAGLWNIRKKAHISSLRSSSRSS